MMKIAIAGTNGLAQFIAYYLSLVTSHTFIFLTRNANVGLSRERKWQVLVVNYEDQDALIYSLKGLDLVISTIGETAQLTLAEAAANARVRHFIPSAFSGPDQCWTESAGRDAWAALLELLEHHRINSAMRYTIFTPGVLYERFGPGGLNEAMQISTVSNRHGAVGEEGNFLVDIRSGKATIPVISAIEELSICLSSVRDVAHYVVAAIQAFEDMTMWPLEFKFCTERLTMSELRAICERVRGAPLIMNLTTPAALVHAFEAAQQKGNANEALAISQHIAVAQAHPAISFPLTDINILPDVLALAQIPTTEPGPLEPFESWLLRAWSTPIPSASSTRASANTSGKKSGYSSRSGSSQKSKRSTPK